MNKSPLFSIIIPTYNSADKLKHALNSIERQSFRDFEVIVCDDGSTDHTKHIIEIFCDKIPLEYNWEGNWGGPARPRNNGLKIAKGKYIAFLDVDDWWYPNKLKIVNKYLHDADILYHDLDTYTLKGKINFKRMRGRYLRRPIFVDLMRNENALIISSVVVKKDIIDRAGGFTEDFLIGVEDFDLWLKISRITEKFVYIPKSLGVYWIETGSLSEASGKRVERLEFVYQKYFYFLGEEDRKQAEMTMNYLIGRTKQKIRYFKEALSFFKKSVKSKNLKFRFRSICWIIILRLLLIFQKRLKQMPNTND